MNFASLKGIRPREWAVRFFFGGAVCVLAGLISQRYGAAIGGLFLAFPAIFPAGASLVESHEKRHKARVGLDGTRRARTVAGVESVGASIGSIGLAAFALVCWLCLTRLSLAGVFVLATLAWALVSIAAWWLRKSRWIRKPHGGQRPYSVFRTS